MYLIIFKILQIQDVGGLGLLLSISTPHIPDASPNICSQTKSN